MHGRTFLFKTNHHACSTDEVFLSQMRHDLEQGDAYIFQNVYPKSELLAMRDYLSKIGQHSLANYHPITQNCPNHHRINHFDQRAYVRGCFHQFNFFPWNQDPFQLFDYFKEIFHLKNRLIGLPAQHYLTEPMTSGCTARIGFQYYPRGIGQLNRHQDPVMEHQLTVPIVLLSEKGEDFQVGGGYVEQADGTHCYLDDVAAIGDVIYINAEVIHGVDPIDPSATPHWLSFQGRWMILFPINRFADNDQIGNSRERND